ncbi:hypothetical protein EC991_008852 [Linnemannia zychae]|nr:hypothetical protein EC991_008852 [Linnemannia zychae]
MVPLAFSPQKVPLLLSSQAMRHIVDVNVGGDNTACYLYQDEDRNINKLIIVNNKRASVEIKVECQKKTLEEVKIGSYGTYGVYVDDAMRDETVWFTLTYHGDVTGYIGYRWNDRDIVYYG